MLRLSAQATTALSLSVRACEYTTAPLLPVWAFPILTPACSCAALVPALWAQRCPLCCCFAGPLAAPHRATAPTGSTAPGAPATSPAVAAAPPAWPPARAPRAASATPPARLPWIGSATQRTAGLTPGKSGTGAPAASSVEVRHAVNAVVALAAQQQACRHVQLGGPHALGDGPPIPHA